jgi:U3 small nucleolar RNA-associated protein 21
MHLLNSANPIGPEEEEEIASLAVHNNDLFASAGPKVIRYQRGKQIAAYSASSPDVKLGQIFIFGEQLLALRQDGKGLLVWKISTLGKISFRDRSISAADYPSSKELESEIKFHSSFNATTMLHPATYLNKVIVGSVEGALQLWNVRTMSVDFYYEKNSGNGTNYRHSQVSDSYLPATKEYECSGDDNRSISSY